MPSNVLSSFQILSHLFLTSTFLGNYSSSQTHLQYLFSNHKLHCLVWFCTVKYKVTLKFKALYNDPISFGSLISYSLLETYSELSFFICYFSNGFSGGYFFLLISDLKSDGFLKLYFSILSFLISDQMSSHLYSTPLHIFLCFSCICVVNSLLQDKL